MTDPIELSDLQIAVMRVLWREGQATVGTVHQALSAERPLALTTVSTLLSRLAKRGLVAHHSEGRQYVYRPLIGEAEAMHSDIHALMDRWFAGKPGVLVNHLLAAEEVEAAELDRLEAMIEAAKRRKEASS